MPQQVAVVTLGVGDLPSAKRFYRNGFGWEPIFENNEIAFYQMNGFVLCLWLADKLADDMCRKNERRPAAIALAHNVSSESEVQPLIDRLVAAGGLLLRGGEAPELGGVRGYVEAPDQIAWEIAWNPAWPIDDEGHVTFAA